MKKIGLIIVLLLCALNSHAQLGVRVGAGFTKSIYSNSNGSTKNMEEYPLGEVGIFYKQKYKSFFVEPCISYVNRNYDNSQGGTGHVELFIPIGYQLQTKLPLRFFAGVSGNYAINSKLYRQWDLINANGTTSSQGIEKVNMLYGFKFGAGVVLKKIAIDLVYEHFLTSHWKVENNYNFFNNFDYYSRGLAIKFSYSFWE